jgi:mercuric ion transport protein
MPDVVLLYETSCPNVPEARSNLLRAFSDANIAASFREVDLHAVDTPAEWRTFGSPTILVDGRDVAGAAPAAGSTCRLYEVDGRLTGAPSVDRIAAGLRGATKR